MKFVCLLYRSMRGSTVGGCRRSSSCLDRQAGDALPKPLPSSPMQQLTRTELLAFVEEDEIEPNLDPSAYANAYRSWFSSRPGFCLPCREP